MLRFFTKLLPWAILLALVVVWHMQPTVLQVVQLKTFDTYQNLWPRDVPQDVPVTVINIDEKSLHTLGQWPWPRTVMAELVEQIFNQGVTALAFDAVFAEPDRTSPELAAEHWPLPDEDKAKLAHLPRHDEQFTEALAGKPVVLGYALDNAPHLQPENDFDLFSDVTGADLLSLGVPRVNALVRNLPELEDNAPALGWFGYIPDQDNIVRRLPLLIRYQDAVFAPLAIKLLRAHSRTPTLKPVRDNFGNMIGLSFGEYTVPTEADGSYWVHFRKHTKLNYVSAADVLTGKVPPEKMQGKMAIVGTSAEGLLDLRATPLQAKVPGVDIHVQIIENILENRFLQRPEWLPWAEHGATLVLGAILLLAVAFLSASLTSVLAAIIFITMPAAGAFAFQQGFLADAFIPVGILLVVFAMETVLKYAKEERERKAVRGAFSHYLSPDMVRLVSKNPEQLQLGGEQRELTILFCDIRSFTTLSEGFTPQELTAFINEYLTPMTDIILQHNGTIDKYMGDAIMAFWNAPLDVPHHPRQACIAVLAMLECLAELNTMWAARSMPAIRIGIGLHTGLATVGNMGSEQRFDYTVMGDAVNLSSRLEGLCKPYGVQVAVSEYVKALVPDGTFLPLDKVIVKGKTEPVDVFELVTMDEPTPEERQEVELITQAVEAYRNRQWDEAEEAFNQTKSHDLLAELYRKRIADYRKNPPPENWRGAWERRSK